MENSGVQKFEKASCSACGGENLDLVIELPDFPLTGVYVKEEQKKNTNLDQGLCLCSSCGHGQLLYTIDPNTIYDQTYFHRSSESPIATMGNDFFSIFLEKITSGRKFKSIVEVGCNDLYLLKKIAHQADQLLGVDPIWKGNDHVVDGKIQVAGGFIEDVDFTQFLGEKPDLIVSAHTFEHIDSPIEVFQNLVDKAADNATFVVEVPGFDSLLNINRFDQIFHQHIQYFSVASFRSMISKLRCEYLTHTFNYSYWGGTLLIAFRKGWTAKSDDAETSLKPTVEHCKNSFLQFKTQLESVMSVLDNIDGVIYGFGGAQMLPTLAYHMGTDLSFLECILDDNPDRHGLTYPHLRARIKRPSASLDLSDASVLITALDSARPIMKRIIDLNPKYVVKPLCLF